MKKSGNFKVKKSMEKTHAALAAPPQVEVLPPDRGADAARAADGIMRGVADALRNAAIGRLYALKAGIGLCAVRGLVGHGEWMEYIAARFPMKSHSTIRRYMKDGEAFCAARGIEAGDVWRDLEKTKQIGPGAALLITDGKEDAVAKGGAAPAVVKQMAEWLAGRETAAGPAAPRKAKDLTAEQQIAAQTDRALQIAADVDEWVNARGWLLAARSAAEAAHAALVGAANKLRAQLSKPAKK
jgi:hypothetical protein